jgi:predicted amidohydrolase
LACQLDIVWHDKEANYARLRSLVDAAQPPPGSLVVAPEMFATGFSMQVADIAETSSGATLAFLAQAAVRWRSHVLAGVITRQADGLGRNEAVLIDPAGREAARYAKRHPFSLCGETTHFAAGEEIVVHAVGPFMLAPTICYDLRFPETYRRAALAGANLIAVIANWPEVRISHWRALLVARAIENQAYVVGVNRSGSDPTLHYTGQSLIVDPWGRLLADAGDGERVIQADLAIEPLEEYRRHLPALADMRRDDAAALRPAGAARSAPG